MSAYYNENDKFAAAWLRELIKAGLIADGEVDERSITDVRPDDLRGFVQCHFFAGIGGWSYALRLAGWPDDRAVWTGSCPCQPFSTAGKGASADDSRHFWPTWFRLIQECGPSVVFGEQVDSIDGLAWFDAVSHDMEARDYAITAFGLPACSLGAPHRRSRLWFVADTEVAALAGGAQGRHGPRGNQAESQVHRAPDRRRRGINRGVADSAGLQFQNEPSTWIDESGRVGSRSVSDENALLGPFWRDAEWMYCIDGKYRPVESGVSPLVDGLPDRLDRLRCLGNAIVPQVAQVFIEAYMSLES